MECWKPAGFSTRNISRRVAGTRLWEGCETRRVLHAFHGRQAAFGMVGSLRIRECFKRKSATCGNALCVAVRSNVVP